MPSKIADNKPEDPDKTVAFLLRMNKLMLVLFMLLIVTFERLLLSKMLFLCQAGLLPGNLIKMQSTKGTFPFGVPF